MRVFQAVLLVFTGLLLLGVPTPAQSASPKSGAEGAGTRGARTEGSATSATDPAQDPKRAATLEKLAASLREREEALQKAQAELTAAPDPASKSKAEEKLKRLRGQIEKLSADFGSYATGVDPNDYDKQEEGSFELVKELVAIVKPLVQELKDVTEEPRQIDQLKKEILEFERRRDLARRAIQNLEKVRTPEIADRLQPLREQWRRRLTDASNRRLIAQDQLDARQLGRDSLLESASSGLGTFFRTRGLHIMMAIAAFFAVFLGLRLLSRPVRALARRNRDAPPSLRVRLISVIFHSMVGLLAVIAALFVFYAAGDWGLLGLSLLFLLGLAWASKEALPRYADQMTLMLNVGAVREGERVVRNGLPWRVERIHMYSHLSNPSLGGRIRVPINDLLEMRSRPMRPNETWFPSEVGDWVMLSGDVRGKVVEQSPEIVRIEHVDGSQTTFQTSSYLGMNPRNISSRFSVVATFGIDYRHQAICTTRIPERMQVAVQEGLQDLLGVDPVQRVVVEFKAAAASSLDYTVIAELSGDVAPRYAAIGRRIQRSLVEACNSNGWEIPFTQITVHQAAG